MQVVWLGRPVACSTWEQATSLPPSLVDDYEQGVQRELKKESFTSGGETIHTLSVTRNDMNDTPPPQKLPRLDPDDHDTANSGLVKR